MSNPANYSPFNKSSMFMHYQNTAYHERNKRNASPVVNTNLRHSLSRKKYAKNPQPYQYNPQSPLHMTQSNRSFCSSLFSPKKQIAGIVIDEPRRVIHKNKSYQKFRSKAINQQNVQMVNRIINTSCQVLNNKKAQVNFENHLKYQSLRRRYLHNGQRRQNLALGKSEHLCPTLHFFNESGLKQRYEKDLGISIKPASSQSLRKSSRSKYN